MSIILSEPSLSFEFYLDFCQPFLLVFLRNDSINLQIIKVVNVVFMIGGKAEKVSKFHKSYDESLDLAILSNYKKEQRQIFKDLKVFSVCL